jgi:hypothetical protein
MAKIALKLVGFENAKSFFQFFQTHQLSASLNTAGVKFPEHSSLLSKRVIENFEKSFIKSTPKSCKDFNKKHSCQKLYDFNISDKMSATC